MQSFLFLVLASSCHCVMKFGRLQSAGVKGLVYCRGKPAKGVAVKLYEKEVLFDRLMQKGKSNKHGAFKLSGSVRELSDIEPMLYIFNKCGKRFARKIIIDIPSKYITHFGQRIKFFDIGKIELSKRYMRAFILLCLIPSCSCLLFGLIGRMQSVGIMGTLKCNGKPAPGVKLKLYEKEIFLDRKMAQNQTDASGFFKMSGSAKEISQIDPQLNIYHKCNHKGICKRKIGIRIPSDYIVKGKQATKYFDIGSLELAMKLKGETTDCIN